MNFDKAYLGALVMCMVALWFSDLGAMGPQGENDNERHASLLSRRSHSERSEPEGSISSKRGRSEVDCPFLIRGHDDNVYVRGVEGIGYCVDNVEGEDYVRLSSITSIQWDHLLTSRDTALVADGMAGDLTTFNLRNANLTPEMMQTLGVVLSHRPLLWDFRIDQRPPIGVLALARALSYCPSLRHVEVGASDVDDTAFQTFLRLAQERNLVSLDLGYNISRGGVKTLWTFMDTKPPALKEVCLWVSGEFTPSDFDPLPRTLVNHPDLKLSFMFMSGSTIDGKVLRDLESLPNRKYLDFLGTQFPRNIEFSFL